MIQEEELLKKAKEAGFDNCRILPAGELSFDHSLRKYCEVNYCGNYGNNYSCPPECGTPEEIEEKTRKFSRVLYFRLLRRCMTLPMTGKPGKSSTAIIR